MRVLFAPPASDGTNQAKKGPWALLKWAVVVYGRFETHVAVIARAWGSGWLRISPAGKRHRKECGNVG